MNFEFLRTNLNIIIYCSHLILIDTCYNICDFCFVFQLMAVEWEAEKHSETGSSISSAADLSSDDLNNGDSDFSEANLDTSASSLNQQPQKCEGNSKRASAPAGDLASISEENRTPADSSSAAVPPIDLSACLDFVQSLGAQVSAMQSAIQKSKECLLDIDSEDGGLGSRMSNHTSISVRSDELLPPLSDHGMENGSIESAYEVNTPSPLPYLPQRTSSDRLPEPTPAEFEDDGCYETPLQVDALRQRFENYPHHPHHHHHSMSNGPVITQDQEYEEVLRVHPQQQNQHRQQQQHHHESNEKLNNDENYMTVSNYENHMNHEAPPQVHQHQPVQLRVKGKSKKMPSKGQSQDGAIYEFPPDDGEEGVGGDTELDSDEERKTSPKEEEIIASKPVEEIVYKYDGPMTFGVDDTSEIFRIEDRDAVRKWDPVSGVTIFYVLS